MNCPVCKSDSVDERGTGAAILNNKAWMCRCIDCRTQFTTWQQDQLTTKDREIAGLKANSSAEMRETLMHQLMTCADEKDALLKKLDDYRQYVNVGHYDDLEKELAEAYSKIDAMNKEGADSLASAGGACMHLQEQLATKDQELADSVPRSRVAAMEVEIQAEKDKLAMVQESCGKEIRDLWYKLSSAQQEVNQYADDRSELSRQLASALAEISRLTAEVELLTKQRADWKALATADAGHQQENVRLKSELGKYKEELKKLQYMPTEDSCEIPEHDETGDDDEHNNSCCGCGRYKCQGCKPDCWLAALLKED
jgi:chromosome segregation ATPase